MRRKSGRSRKVVSNENKELSAAGIGEVARMPAGWNASDESVDEYTPEEESRRMRGYGEGEEEAENPMHVSCNLCGTIVSKKSMKKHKESQKCQNMRQTDFPSPAKRNRRHMP
jgi:hypothetical protein